MDDLISRQQAIDALDVLCQEHRYKIPGKVETYSQYNEAWQDALDRAEGAIGNLPSAQPEKRAEERTETHACDLVDRQAAIDKFKPWLKVKGYSEGELNMLRAVINELENLPPTEPKLIRCRDCYWWTKQEASLQGRCALTGTYPTGAFFCGNARKRGEVDGND